MYALPPRRERRLIRLLALVQFTLIIDFMVMLPLGPQIMGAFHIAPAAFAAAVSAYSWCSGLSGLFAATIMDRFDRRRLLFVTYALFALSNLACASATTYPLLIAARAFAGVTGGLVATTVMAIVADVIPAERRGAATGVIMTAFSLASIAGVPVGILIGAHFGWASTFWLLVVLCVTIVCAGASAVPPLRQHLRMRAPVPVAEALPALIRLLTYRLHVKAFALTFVMMLAQMIVIPFMSPVIVANHGVSPKHLSWLYMAGGAATFFTSRAVGRLSDRIGHRIVFRIFGALTIVPVLIMTHLPQISYLLLLPFFAAFMVVSSSRMVPMQAIITLVPAPAERGAFLSANGAVQSLAGGCGAWLGGLMLSNDAAGHILGYGVNGWVSVSLAALALIWIGFVTSSPAQQQAVSAAPQPISPEGDEGERPPLPAEASTELAS